MQPEAPNTPRPTLPSDPLKDRLGRALPENLVALIYIVRVLLSHARRLTETVRAKTNLPSFALVACAAGTHDTLSILTRIQRGILRLIALEKYLLERAHKGRDVPFVEPRQRAPARKTEEPSAEAPARPRRRPFDPHALHLPTMQELDAEVRLRPIGRTIAYICMDLALIPAFCTGEFWNAIFDIMRWYGGSFTTYFALRARRKKTYQRDRDKYPDTWVWDWRDTEKPRVRQVLGYLIGELPPDPLPA